ncbi:pteridine reductase [Legionella hackeliae]|uniref:Pteridine reductase n=1 Tax=Legionella hackeliae TaxID=449 RepID=A0A0A8UQF4_LEGHA|nr:pteridine reductase [Legionella hackeliae]KTD13479.1 pteridine reductase [Legionella hackeliae]CEK09322.1 Pteridine reductase [Legionella hackeliae]STX49227.1 pteridine reductase [Legionella hackeliae]
MGKHILTQANKHAVKVALVTGAARRIGAAIVSKLHEAKFKVVIHCHQSLRDAQMLAATLNEQHPDSALVISQDLNEKNAANKLIAAALVWGGRLDVLVNNASIFNRTMLIKPDEAHWNDLFDTNVKLPFFLSMEACSHLAKHQGVIINLTDIHAEKPLKDYAVYCQTKAALVMQTKALAREFAPDVRVNAVAPGAIMWPEHGNALNLEIQQKIVSQTPLKRHGHPSFIAQAVLALVENPFITGQILSVDGGRSIA